MDEKVLALMGAAAGVTFAGRRLRPVAKLAIRGVVAAVDATVDATEGARRELAVLYTEAKSEQRGTQPHAEAASAPQPSP